MDDRTLRVLEYHKIRAQVVEAAATSLGKELAAALVPATELAEVAHCQAETAEAVSLLVAGPGFALGGVRDVRQAVRHAGLGASLEPHLLLDCASTAAAARRLRRFIGEQAERAPLLADIAGQLGDFGDLETEVQRCISDEGEVLDRASPALADIRRKIGHLQGRIKDRLDTMVKSSTLRTYLQDALVTVREDRYVVPVKVEHRAQVPGIVHDQSATGSTLFIEPMAVVELNNELKRLRMDEQAEVQRILLQLSLRVAQDADAWLRTLAALAELDFAAAKGLLALRMRAVQPALNADGRVDLRTARHPLLGAGVVPIDVQLGGDFDVLLITGPNTGGKTVTLKTVGLFSLMAQAGLQIPAADRSSVAIFPQVFADIGDEQSIEQSLSTFSSHMTAIVRLLDNLETGALVLLDEIGAGTDPAEGAALARAVLEHLQACQARVIATTHYPDLKAYAATHPRVANGAVEFDVETLRPTYRLRIGVPGASCALEISARLGLAAPLVERARSFLSQEAESVEALLQQIQSTRLQVEEHRATAAADRGRSETLRRETEARLSAAREKEQELLGRARAQAEEVLRRAKAEAETVIRDLKGALAEQDQTRQAEAIAMARSRLRKAWSGAQVTPAEPPAAAPTDLRPGEAVRVRSLGAFGHALSSPDASGQVQVQAGILKMQVPVTDLERVDEARVQVHRVQRELPAGATGLAGLGKSAQAGSRASTGQSTGREGGSGRRRSGPLAGAQRGEPTGQSAGLAQAGSFSTELDLRGLTVAEALEAVDNYLDDAILAGAEQVRIIHGKGTGALRRAVQDHLRSHREVLSARLGETGEGGDGVTVARLAE